MKKITSLLMAVLLICTMMTFTAIPAFAEDEVTSGDMENGLHWDLTDGTLTISKTGEGSGAMPDMEYSEYPWYRRSGSGIYEIVIDSGVTYIGNKAFHHYVSLKTLRLNSTVSLGNDVFVDCESLSNILFGENGNITRIGNNCFCNCTALSEIVFKGDISDIGVGAFSSCHWLRSVTFTGSVEKIESAAFRRCENLTDIYFCKNFFPNSSNSIFNQCAENSITVHLDNDFLKIPALKEVTGDLSGAGTSAAGSTLSKGNMTIIVGITCAVIFGLGGFLLGKKKKKPALAEGAEKEAEE